MEVVKEIISQNKQYKAEIIRRIDGVFSIEIFIWHEDEWFDCWEPIRDNVSIIDTSKHAIEIALEKLRNLTGEDIIIWFKVFLNY